MDSRKDHTILPPPDELEKILAQEQQRPLPVGKDNVHYPDFSTVISLFKHYGIDTYFFDINIFPEELAATYRNLLRGKIDIVIDQITAKLLDSKEDKPTTLLNNLYDYLSEEDPVKNTDLILVFGAKSTLRIAQAVELFKDNPKSFLITTGGGPLYEQDRQIAEAVKDRDFAIAGGVPEERIIVESTSITMPDIVRSSLNLLDEKGIEYSSITLVNSPFSQRRGWAHFMKYIPSNIDLRRVNCPVSDKFSKQGWFTNEEGIKIIINEFFKMKYGVLTNTA